MSGNQGVKPVFHWPVIAVSDTHLGHKNAGANRLLEFLQHTSCATLILVGDFINGPHLDDGFPEMHMRVLDEVNRKIASGVDVIHVRGNHDERADSINIGRYVRELQMDIGGKPFLFLHGDQFDHFVKSKTGPGSFIEHFREAALGAANDVEAQGVVCGHIHRAVWDADGSVAYGNTGDWMESCTALVFDENGRGELVRWLDLRQQLELGFGPRETNQNPAAMYRAQTERQVAEMRKLWPARVPVPMPG